MKRDNRINQLMDYLYGEMSDREKQAFELELESNDELRKKLEEMKATRSLLGQLEEEKVSVPTYMFPASSTKRSSSNHILRLLIGVAAAAVLIILLGRWSNFQANYYEGGLQISFGKAAVIPDRIDSQELVTEQLIKEVARELQLQESQERERLLEKLEAKMVSQQSKINEQFSDWTQKQASQMSALEKTHALQQQVFTEQFLTLFANYLEEQRREDLAYLISRIELLEYNQDLREIELEELLSALDGRTGIVYKQ
ncbi:MAG: hypothetical protein LAT68_11130 [Cyclobacteriaceae bacterium]|nr:hypothetical protein [Cyclobacteriaceae bacterium]MCH8516868.1 hypothetical protein [Cyclobacteriaceae bacterium]